MSTRRTLSAASLIRENTALHKEILQLKNEKADLKSEIDRLERIIEGMKDNQKHNEEADDIDDLCEELNQ